MTSPISSRKRDLEESQVATSQDHATPSEDPSLDEPDHCAICLGDILNEAYLSPCEHGQFCFACVWSWLTESRRCPLCMQSVDHVRTHVKDNGDAQIHYLFPLNPDKESKSTAPSIAQSSVPRPRPSRPVRWGKRAKIQLDERVEAEQALARRKWVYRNGLYAKVSFPSF